MSKLQAPKGHESIAQALAWVIFFIGNHPEGAAEIVLPHATGFPRYELSPVTIVSTVRHLTDRPRFLNVLARIAKSRAFLRSKKSGTKDDEEEPTTG
jgi:hypothetical protein